LDTTGEGVGGAQTPRLLRFFPIGENFTALSAAKWRIESKCEWAFKFNLELYTPYAGFERKIAEALAGTHFLGCNTKWSGVGGGGTGD
jgi:hypothetical protein